MKPPVRRNRKRVIIDLLATKAAVVAGKLTRQDGITVEKWLPGFIDCVASDNAIRAHVAYPGDEEHGG
jgi:hypothetical protein